MYVTFVGTAGRREDGERLNRKYWDFMYFVANSFVEIFKPDVLVSGGAAYSDALVPRISLERNIPCELYFPCAWDVDNCRFEQNDDKFDPGRTANYYHKKFKEVTGIDGLADLQAVINDGKSKIIIGNGFKARNTQVAAASNVLLAFTFGDGPTLKDSGTKDTFDKFLADKNNRQGYHCCLNNKRLYRIV